MHLTVNAGTGSTWNLIWSHYEGFAFPSYDVYRGTSLGNMSYLTTIQSSLNSYSDLTPPAGALFDQVAVVSPGGCSPTRNNYSTSRSNIVKMVVTGVQNTAAKAMNVYPNPNTGDFNIALGTSSPAVVEIYNSIGELVQSTAANQGSQVLTVSIKDRAPGVYMIRVTTDNGVRQQTITVQ